MSTVLLFAVDAKTPGNSVDIQPIADDDTRKRKRAGRGRSMSRHFAERPDWHDDEEEHVPDDEDEEYVPEADAEQVIPCPYCTREINEDSQRCPYCEQYISREDSPPAPKVWIVIGTLLCLFAVYRWIFC